MMVCTDQFLSKLSQNLEQSGLLWVGDCKMSSLETRGLIHSQQHYYLAPLSRVGKVSGLIEQWVKQVICEVMPGQEIIRVDSQAQYCSVSLSSYFFAP